MDMVGESATSPTSPWRTCARTFSSADGIAPGDARMPEADARAEAAQAARTSASDPEKRTARAFPGVRSAAPSRLASLQTRRFVSLRGQGYRSVGGFERVGAGGEEGPDQGRLGGLL